MRMIVAMALTIGLDVAGAGLSVDGMSPAKAAPESAHVKAIATRIRFIMSSPSWFNARVLVTKTA